MFRNLAVLAGVRRRPVAVLLGLKATLKLYLVSVELVEAQSRSPL
jgi:hypothetical protein